ncbi:tyrosine-type recombinase/integrase [Mesorhizobium sp. WSM4982]|uniref:tyrosine-type recombinase/integrase n=1 Tax=Mesorhizobium sp. WSM4982 TaxID=3038550 RepID=UPI0024155289|nr:tyrosine-type recombinase/integrase [Mesorhizobium sp. WSM4982]MDG4856396.1 tyrosine-type recombinase/integrase [Mesorhizobium sp. WSM4982]
MPLANPYVQRIPADVKPKTPGLSIDIPVGDTITPYTITAAAQAIRLSLKTSDMREHKARKLKVDAFLETVWNALRRDELVPQSLNNCVKLAEAMYLGWAESREARTDAIVLDHTDKQPDGSYPVLSLKQNIPPDTEPPEFWAAMVEKTEAQLEALEDGELDTKDLDTIIRKELLKLRGVMGTDPDTMQILRREFLRAMRDGYAQRKRTADGDFTPDPKAKRFPEDFTGDDMVKRPPRPASGVRITELVDDWWEEARATGRSLATYESYKLTFKHLAAFLKHDDAHRVRPTDIVAFKDARLKSGVSAGTVHLNLAGLKAVFEWARSNLKVPTNPARDVKVTKTKAVKLRDKDFTEAEAIAVLQHADKVTATDARSAPHNVLAKYWVPWLCAYTGARVGEMVQLRPKDLREDEKLGCWVLTIHPEAGTVKDKEVREVVLHSHLVERGFPEMVEACTARYLFLPDTNNFRRTMKTVTGMLADFAREIVKDPNVAPNHGWRHSFKTRGRDAGISDSVLDAICGHTPQTQGGRYGRVPLSTQAKAMEVYPRYL